MELVVFWAIALLTTISGFLIVYHHAIYPLILSFAARGHSTKRTGSPRRQQSDVPSVDIIIPAYNEENTIAQKVRNLSELNMRSRNWKAIVASDGCTDKTADIAYNEVRRLGLEDYVTVKVYERNRGKVAVINELVNGSSADLIAFSDVSADIPSDGIDAASLHFEDPNVGVVSGTYQMTGAVTDGEKAYWAYQTKIKMGEAALGAPLGAHGAFYMIRRTAFRELEADTINDDFIIPIRIVLDGYKSIYDTTIVATENEIASARIDLNRRRRIASGNAQQLFRLFRLLNPKYGGIAFAFASGKALRVFMPFLMIFAFLGSIALADNSILFAAAAIAQAIGYSVALLGFILPPRIVPRAAKVLSYIVSGHVSSLFGVSRYALGLDHGPWRRAATH